jgi:2-amino-4-hydroxy-6-hydroxymethyldihydropteridine diphosphokinase
MIENFPYRYILSLGSNLGDRKENCKQGLEGLTFFGKIISSSSLIETAPLKSEIYPNLKEDNYLNQVCDLASYYQPYELYKNIVSLEDRIGHSRERKWLPRELDVDILLWAQNNDPFFSKCSLLSYKKNSLIIPHCGLLERDFLLTLCENYLGFSAKELIFQKEKEKIEYF